MASECYAPSELARTINKVPYPGFTDGVATGNSLDELVSAVVQNSISRAAFWGGFIVILAVFFMALTSIFYCCLCCLRKKHSQGSTALKIGCGGCVIVLITACLAIIAVAFWAETSLHGDFEASARGVIGALDQFDNDNSNPAGFEGFLSFETARHRVVLAFLAVAILVLLVLTVSVILSPIFKKTAFLKIMLAVLGVATLLISVLAGLGIAFLILLGDVCVTSDELYGHVVGGTLCESRFEAICRLSADGLYNLAGVRCEEQVLGNLLGVCNIDIGRLYRTLFQPVTNFCMSQLFCDASFGFLLELFTTTSCVSTCRGLNSLGDLYQVFGTQCERQLSSVLCTEDFFFPRTIALLGCQNICGFTVGDFAASAVGRLAGFQCPDQDLRSYCNVVSGRICTDQHPVVGDLNTICNEAYSSGFILLMMVCVLIIALIIIQVAVATYAVSIRAVDSDPDSDYGQSSTGISLRMKAFKSGVREV